jgi:NAD(P)-dependent dehydrogenase (short-subunit alcohol dehydrogenase family)
MHQPSFELKGKVAWITGASRGIGRAIAETFAAAGAKIIISSRKQESLEAVADHIRANGGQVFPMAVHTGDSDAIKNLVNSSIDAYGGIDILVNNAATNPHFGPLLSAEESHWDKILDVNVKGYARTIRASVDSMRQRGGGKIINVASINGLRAEAGLGIYSASKAAVIMLTQVLALELAQENIQVNAIAPQGRIGQPGELSGIAIYLASAASDFTTGAVFVVDGGQLAGNNLFQSMS